MKRFTVIATDNETGEQIQSSIPTVLYQKMRELGGDYTLTLAEESVPANHLIAEVERFLRQKGFDFDEVLQVWQGNCSPILAEVETPTGVEDLWIWPGPPGSFKRARQSFSEIMYEMTEHLQGVKREE